MTRTHPPARTARRLRPLLLLGPVVAIALLAVAISAPRSDSSSASPSAADGSSVDLAPPAQPSRGDGDDADDGDGRLADGVTVFDDVAALANLDPGLLAALRLAATDAGDEGIAFMLNSGWRSPEYQDELLREAIAEYGSAEEAARWVATAGTSPHVSGDAVDLGQVDAVDWLSQHGAAYGLCQVYDNEPWHWELRPDAVTSGCPATYADPTEDPRMRR
ncbi:D-alanyl-D-alanine carboxypeptidase family protein [Agromyces salentinus]|uniref:D-alanyl-D-alanine carboxypeptidase-like core domain-containing protein n=1 Tax=Agromyces salentinus TaxID=269421 RepID=A0ABP4YTS9_9MICO|nr:D-alanyl-D-alanine carboxypeptidase family protein [Agromyces salentinus]